MEPATLKRFLRSDYLDDLLVLYRADRLATGTSLEAWEYANQNRNKYKPEELFPTSLITGNDLIRLGYLPGPLFKKILYDLETLQLNGKIRTVAEAEEIILREYPEKKSNFPKIKV
jgi:poly(A) polymerase